MSRLHFLSVDKLSISRQQGSQLDMTKAHHDSILHNIEAHNPTILLFGTTCKWRNETTTANFTMHDLVNICKP